MIELQDKIGSPPNQCKGLHSKTFEKLVSNPFLYAHSSSMCLNDLESVLVCHSIGLFSKWKLVNAEELTNTVLFLKLLLSAFLPKNK